MATRREREERAELARLQSKYGEEAPKRQRRRPVPDDDDDSPVIMLSGKRADSFLSKIFGDDVQADDAESDEDEDEDEDDDEDEDEEPVDDPEPPAGHGYFKGRRGRG